MGDRRRLLLVGIVVATLLAVGYLASRPDGLPQSETCEDVEPGNARLRSVPPDAAPFAEGAESAESAEGAEGAEAEPAFRPEEAERVYCDDLADPFVLALDRPIGQRLFAFGTGTASANVPVLVSGGLVRSEEVLEALPTLPSWSSAGAVWAPSVLARDDRFVLYYTTRHAESGLQCISHATSERAQGPYEDSSTAPLVCPTERGGAIDPSPFVNVDGTAFLLWKADGNCCDLPVGLFAQELDATGTALAGDPVELLAPSQPWEGGLVEAPVMVLRDGGHHLFYSANDWSGAGYAIGWATCEAVTGPCTKPLDEPWLSSNGEAVGPGGQEVFADDEGDLHMVFHAWDAAAIGYDAGGFRRLYAVGLRFVDGRPVTS